MPRSNIERLKGRGAYGSVLRLGLPILIGQLGMIVLGFADTKMVGLYSTPALASASFVNNMFNVAIFACIGFTYGLTPLVAALFTQGRLRSIGALMRSALLVNLLFGLIVTLVMGILYLFLDRLDQPVELLPLIRPYFLVYLAGVVPVALFNAFAQWSYAINRTAMPMWIILGCNLLNIAGNWVLIYGRCGFPELGLLGAGIATLVSRVLCLVMIAAVFSLSSRNADYRRGFAEGSVRSADLSRIVRTSLPVALQMTFESASFSVAALMAGWIGAIALASFQIIVIIGTLGFCIYYSVAAAVSVLVANAAGADDRRLMRHVAFSGYHILLLLATVSSLLFIFAGPDILRQFTADEDVLNAALALIVPLVLYQYGDATQINFANALRGTSHVLPMVWIAFVSYAVVGVPATYLLGFTVGLGAYGIVLSFSVSLFLAAGLFTYCFLRQTRE